MRQKFVVADRMYTIKEAHILALRKGGECLTNEYPGHTQKLTWKCQKGHIWDERFSNVRDGRWCPKCTIEERKEEIRRRKFLEKGHLLAKKMNGKCLSNEYHDQTEKMVWQCDKGHTWKEHYVNIRNGKWCPVCAEENKRIGPNETKRIAEAKRGKILSKGHISPYQKVTWQCQKRHTWEASYVNIKKGKWCPICAKEKRAKKRRKHFLREAKKLAELKEGECLSKKYIKATEKMTWKCHEGHRWEATYASIKSGSWCPRCAAENRKKSLEKDQALATKRGGNCI